MIIHSFKNVIDVNLTKEISEYIGDMMDGPLIEDDFYRTAVVDVAYDLMEDLLHCNKIDNFKIIGDDRNNNDEHLHTEFILDIHFTQRNCFVLTKLRFTQTIPIDLQAVTSGMIHIIYS